MYHAEQECAHFCSELCIVRYETGALWELWGWSIARCYQDRYVMNYVLQQFTFKGDQLPVWYAS